ncbi:MAG: DUF2089 domain-containing protein [Desulfurococcales archaeon]|nr:DUF2089 domain-containing protein [Desulfurococcales archaeon]
MPHPRVVEMRRRLVKLMTLAEEARKNGRGKQAARILDRLDKGEITYRQALERLRKLSEGRR